MTEFDLVKFVVAFFCLIISLLALMTFPLEIWYCLRGFAVYLDFEKKDTKTFFMRKKKLFGKCIITDADNKYSYKVKLKDIKFVENKPFGEFDVYHSNLDLGFVKLAKKDEDFDRIDAITPEIVKFCLILVLVTFILLITKYCKTYILGI